MSERTCATCKHSALEAGGLGCRRYPPRSRAGFVLVDPKAWCGEQAPRVPVIAVKPPLPWWRRWLRALGLAC